MRVWILLLLLVGCAKDVHVRYPVASDVPTGTIVLLLSTAASGVSVAIEGLLVVEDVHTDRIVISGVPIGGQEVVMSANGASNALKLWVTSDHAVTIPIGIPDVAPGLVKTIIGTLVSVVAYTLIR